MATNGSILSTLKSFKSTPHSPVALCPAALFGDGFLAVLGGLFPVFPVFPVFFSKGGKDAKKGVKIGNSGGLIRIDTVICYGVSIIIIYWEHGNTHNNNKREASTGAGYGVFFLFPIFICHLGTTGNTGNKNWEQITKIGNKIGLFPEVGNAPSAANNCHL